ncbi:polyprenyl synthetase family protein [Aureimonas ureilytica]|uniref:polyprenyl synthetase family protein n=1 Tax=Aureimonas ureilytica TaxID=401562 RepID=UPI00036E2A8C|nr:polyprenyl synthetase family protein [Aureimonas ureilytica]
MTAGPQTTRDLLTEVDRRLATLTPCVIEGQSPLDLALRDGVLTPGKRLRPLVTLLVAQALGGSHEAALDAGCALEMVHAASLILDDLPCMDDAELRRGQPTLHRAHGEDVAVLCAIALLSEAYGTLARLPGVDGGQRGECVLALAEAVGTRGLVAGQYQDLRGGRGPRPVGEIDAANGLKTGSLFTAAVELGAIVSRAGADCRASLTSFARELGLAFQLLDDLLDVAGPSAVVLGKDIGKDAAKSTIVSIIGPEQVGRRIDRHVDEARAHLAAALGPASRLEALLMDVFDRSLGPRRMAEAAKQRELELGAL